MSERSPVFFHIWRKLQGAYYNWSKRKLISVSTICKDRTWYTLSYQKEEKKLIAHTVCGKCQKKLKVSCTMYILQPSSAFRGASAVVANPTSWPDSWRQVELGLRTQKCFLEAVLSFRASWCTLLNYPVPQKEPTRKLRLLWLQVFPLWWWSCKKYRVSHIRQLCV